MIILYHPKLGTELERYGIDIPLWDDRSDQVFVRLEEDFPILRPFDLLSLPPVGRKELELAHIPSFLDDWFNDELFPAQILNTYDCHDPNRYNPDKAQAPITWLRKSILDQVAATCYAVELALDHGSCYFLGGGMHHARTHGGAGFCPVNDIVIAIRKAQIERRIKNVLVLDIDAHMGDGTAEITHGDSTITTVSFHMARGWPIDGELSIIPSDYDIPFSQGEEALYLERLQNQLYILESSWEEKKWDLVFVVDGADPYQGDELKSSQAMKLSKEQLLGRDMMIYKWARSWSIPQVWVMAGGYGKEAPSIYSQFLLKILHLMG